MSEFWSKAYLLLEVIHKTAGDGSLSAIHSAARKELLEINEDIRKDMSNPPPKQVIGTQPAGPAEVVEKKPEENPVLNEPVENVERRV